jgi:hypothetical protein
LRRFGATTTAHTGVDRAAEPWFAVPGPTSTAAARLNLVGRERNGVIHPGAQAREALAFLDLALRELVNVDTGHPAIANVETHAPGEHDGGRRPDLAFRWSAEVPLSRVWSPRLGQLACGPGSWRTGDHRCRSLLLALGPGIARGARRSLTIPDVTATLAASLDCEMPAVDGRARSDLLPRTPLRASVARR